MSISSSTRVQSTDPSLAPWGELLDPTFILARNSSRYLHKDILGYDDSQLCNNQLEIGHVNFHCEILDGFNSTLYTQIVPRSCLCLNYKCKNENVRQMWVQKLVLNPNTTTWIKLFQNPEIFKMKESQTWEEVDNFQWYAHLTIFFYNYYPKTYSNCKE